MEAFEIKVFRRNGQLWVSPSVVADVGIKSLPGFLRVDSPVDLPRALEEATALALEAQKLPRSERFPPGRPFWEVAGARSWEEFLRGTTAVAIMRSQAQTRIAHLVRHRETPMLVPDGAWRELPPDLPLSEVARIVLEEFAAHS